MTEHHIHIQFECENDILPENLIQAALTTLQLAEAPSGDLSIIVTTNQNMQRLNLQFAQVDAPTDVLSFPNGEIDPDLGGRYFGDVLLAQAVAAKQANTQGHSLDEELMILTVHGVLHLIGYDHGNPEEKQKMWQIQEKVLTTLHLPMVD